MLRRLLLRSSRPCSFQLKSRADYGVPRVWLCGNKAEPGCFCMSGVQDRPSLLSTSQE